MGLVVSPVSDWSGMGMSSQSSQTSPAATQKMPESQLLGRLEALRQAFQRAVDAMDVKLAAVPQAPPVSTKFDDVVTEMLKLCIDTAVAPAVAPSITAMRSGGTAGSQMTSTSTTVEYPIPSATTGAAGSTTPIGERLQVFIISIDGVGRLSVYDPAARRWGCYNSRYSPPPRQQQQPPTSSVQEASHEAAFEPYTGTTQPDDPTAEITLYRRGVANRTLAERHECQPPTASRFGNWRAPLCPGTF